MATTIQLRRGLAANLAAATASDGEPLFTTDTHLLYVYYSGTKYQIGGSGSGDALTSNPLSQFAATTSLQLKGVISDETGSGALVFATSPTLVTPILGTPTSGTLTNCTGLPAAGLTASAGSILFGRYTGSAGAGQEITIGSGLSLNTGTGVLSASGGGGTVTSVDGSGGSTGLTLTGGAITTSGTLTLGGRLNIASGGTDATTAIGAWDALANISSPDLASSTTPDLGGTSGQYVNITGTTTITGFTAAGSAAAWRMVRFAGALTLTHNATSLILPGGANITTAAGDVAEFRQPVAGSGNWICVSYQRIATPPPSGTNTGDQTSVTGNAGTATALATGRTISISGDLTYTSPTFDGTGNVTAAGTLATVNGNVGTFGSATKASVVTVNAKGLVTAASESTVTPAVGSITGLGTGVATFLATPSSANLAAAVTDETGSGALVFATSPTLVTPALGTPASGVLTNCTGTAAGLTAGTVTTNANLTGDVTSSGNATTLKAVSGFTTADPALADLFLGYDTSATANRQFQADRVLGLKRTAPGGRLTLTTGVPVTISDVTGATNVYYTPCAHDNISLWDGTRWVDLSFAETTLALGTLTSGKNYDILGYLSSGALALELLAWNTDTARTTAMTLQDGRYCKSGDKTRLYLGTIRTTATTTTEDSNAKRFVWNHYNRRRRSLRKTDSGTTWAYATATWRNWNNSSSNRVEWVTGIEEDAVVVQFKGRAYATAAANNFGGLGIGIDVSGSTTPTVWDICGNGFAFAYDVSNPTPYEGYPGVGYHFAQAQENGNTGGTVTFVGEGSQPGRGLWGDIQG